MYLVLLTNAVHPTRDNNKLGAVRREAINLPRSMRGRSEPEAVAPRTRRDRSETCHRLALFSRGGVISFAARNF